MFLLVLSYGISTTLLQKRFPFHPSKGVHWCSRKSLFELAEPPVRRYFEKTTASKISGYFVYFLFKYTRRPSWDFSKKYFRTAILKRTY